MPVVKARRRSRLKSALHLVIKAVPLDLTMHLKFLAALKIIFCAGCGAKHAESQPPPLTKPAPLTAKQWEAAYEEMFVKTSVVEKDGSTTYLATCKGPVHCMFFAEHDAFNKVTRLLPVSSEFAHFAGFYSGNASIYATVGLLLPDCGLPLIFVKSSYFSKRGWLFMNRLSVLNRGQLIIDRDMPSSDVLRENEDYGVTETFNFSLSNDEIRGLRGVTTTSPINIRLTGTKGFVPFKADAIKAFREGATDSLAGLDVLATHLSGADPAACR